MSKLIKIFVQFFVFGVFCGQLANAIECYTCDSTKDKECSKMGKNAEIPVMECTLNVIRDNLPEFLNGIVNVDFFQTTADEIPMGCQKIIITKGDETFTYRGCQLNTKDSCVDAQSQLDQSGQTDVKIVDCQMCSNEDKCNFSTKINFSIRLIFVMLAFIKLVY